MNQQKQQIWIIWFALLSGVLLIRFFLAADATPIEGEPDWLIRAMVFAPLLVSTAIRHTVLIAQKTTQAKMTMMIIGLSIAESALFLTIFLAPKEGVEFLNIMTGLTFLTMALYAPTYINQS